MPNNPKEIILSTIVVRQSVKLLALKLVLLEILFAFFLLLLFTLFDFLDRNQALVFILQIYSAIFLVLLIIFKIAATLIVTLQWVQHYYEFRPDRLVFRSGIFSPEETEYDYSLFKFARLRQDFPGKILNYGSIVLARPGGGELCLCDVPDPGKYLQLLEKTMALAPKINIVLKGDEGPKKGGFPKESDGEIVS